MFGPWNLRKFGKGMDPYREPSFLRGYGKSFRGSSPNCQGMLMTGSAYIWIHLGSFLGGRTIFSPNWSVCWVPVFYIFLQHHVTLRKKTQQTPYMLQIWNIYLPGASKWPFYPLVEGHDSPLKGSRFHPPKKVTIELPGLHISQPSVGKVPFNVWWINIYHEFECNLIRPM